MTAETLKPFITPNGVDHFPSDTKSRPFNGRIIAIALTATLITLTIVLVSVVICKNTIRISKLETELKTLNDVVKSMQNRLGLHYLDDISDFEKELTNALIDDPTSVDDVDSNADDEDDNENFDDDDVDVDDDDDDDEDENDDLEYDEMIQKLHEYGEDADDDDDDDYSNASDDDNLYDDFEKFKDSKKKQRSLNTREKRAIANASNGLQIYETSILDKLNKTEQQNAVSDDLVKISHPSAQAEEHTSSQHRKRKPVMRAQSANADVVRKVADNHNNRYFVGEKREERRYSPLRHHGHNRRRKFPIIKSGDSLISAKSISGNLMSFTPAAHFHLNRKVPDRHSAIRVDSYPGDMYIGSPSFSNQIAYEQYFVVENGVLTVKEPGFYYIYAQVCYNNSHDQNGFVIFHGHKPYLQCLNTVPTNMPLKIHTCHTSGLIFLEANETIHLRDFHTDRNAILKDTNNRSYFGLIKI